MSGLPRSKEGALALALAAAVLAAGIAGGLLAWQAHERDLAERQERADYAWSRRSLLGDVLRIEGVELSWEAGPDGVEAPRLEIGDEARPLVEALLAAYAADPHAPGELSMEELESEIGEDLVDVLLSERGSTPALAFAEWLGEPAELVYREDSTDTAHQPGEEVPGSTSNFDYAVDRNNQYSNYQYKWEHERQQGGAS